MEEVIITAQCGGIKGKRSGDCYGFLGIPYATAGRFQKPVPIAWKGVKDCLEYGAAPPQPNYRGKRPANMEFSLVGSEDCLNLNVWTKHLEASAKRPVVVFIYGGAFQVGKNSFPTGAGDRFMEQEDMVYVSVNYRVGVMGFLELGDRYGGRFRGSGNCGMWDLLTALRWVDQNIESFGGDRNRIILMGISAGSKAIGALLTLPEVQKLCRRIIIESGAMQAFRTPETAMAVTRDYQKYLPSGCDLLDAPAETLVEAQAEFCACEGSTCFFGPVLESPFSAGWREQWNAGACFRGKAIIGSGYHELVGLTQKEGFLERAEQVAFDLFGKNGALAAEKQKELVREGTDPLEGWERVFSDFMYRFYSDHFAKTLEQEGNDIWVYSFDYPPARHGQGFFFLQGQVEMPGEELAEEKVAEARKISDFFRARVREFILNDEPDPNLWPRYQGGNKMVFDVNSHMQYRPSDTLEGFPERVFCR